MKKKRNRNKLIKIYLRCRHCSHMWIPRKRKPKWCPKCHNPNWESITNFTLLKEKIQSARKTRRKKYTKTITFLYKRPY